MRRYVARSAAALAVAAAGACAAGVGLATAGLMEGRAAMALVTAGAVLAVLACASGLIGLGLARAGGGSARAAVFGTVVGGVIVATVAMPTLSALRAPLINDISTDTAGPPAFSRHGPAARDAARRGRTLDYPRSFAERQRAAYPDLVPLTVPGTPDAVAEAVRRALARLGWAVVLEAPGGEHYEATVTSPVFRFVDDVVVRLSPERGAVTVAVRSRSRVGKGDLGANARHIRRLVSELSRPSTGP